MPSVSIRDIIDKVRSVQVAVACRLREIDAVAKDDRLRMLTEYWSSSKHATDQWVSSGPDDNKALDVWLPRVPTVDLDRKVAELLPNSTMSVDEVIERLLKIDQEIEQFFNAALGYATGTEAEDLIESFIKLRSQIKREAAMDAEGTMDM